MAYQIDMPGLQAFAQKMYGGAGNSDQASALANYFQRRINPDPSYGSALTIPQRMGYSNTAQWTPDELNQIQNQNQYAAYVGGGGDPSKYYDSIGQGSFWNTVPDYLKPYITGGTASTSPTPTTVPTAGPASTTGPQFRPPATSTDWMSRLFGGQGNMGPSTTEGPQPAPFSLSMLYGGQTTSGRGAPSGPTTSTGTPVNPTTATGGDWTDQQWADYIDTLFGGGSTGRRGDTAGNYGIGSPATAPGIQPNGDINNLLKGLVDYLGPNMGVPQDVGTAQDRLKAAATALGAGNITMKDLLGQSNVGNLANDPTQFAMNRLLTGQVDWRNPALANQTQLVDQMSKLLGSNATTFLGGNEATSGMNLGDASQRVLFDLISGNIQPQNTADINASVGRALNGQQQGAQDLTNTLWQYLAGGKGNELANYSAPGTNSAYSTAMSGTPGSNQLMSAIQNLLGGQGQQLSDPSQLTTATQAAQKLLGTQISAPTGTQDVNNYVWKTLTQSPTDYAQAFKEQVYNPQRDALLSDLASRGVLDSGERLRQESDLFNKSFMNQVMLADQANKQNAAQIGLQAGAQDIGRQAQNMAPVESAAQILLGAGGASSNIQQQNIQNALARLQTGGALQGQAAGQQNALASLLGDIGSQQYAQKTGSVMNPASLQLNALSQGLGREQNQGNYALQGYGTTNNLLAGLLGQASNTGLQAGNQALAGQQLGTQQFGQLNSDMARFLGLGQNQFQLGQSANQADITNALNALGAQTGILSDIRNFGQGQYSTNLSAINDLVRQELARQAGLSQIQAQQNASNNSLIGQGIGAAGGIGAALIIGL